MILTNDKFLQLVDGAVKELLHGVVGLLHEELDLMMTAAMRLHIFRKIHRMCIFSLDWLSFAAVATVDGFASDVLARLLIFAIG